MSEIIEVQLDDPRSLMYEQLCEQFGEGVIRSECDQHIAQMLTELYDNREELQPVNDNPQ